MSLDQKVDEKTESLAHTAISRARQYITGGPNRDDMIRRLKDDLRLYFEKVSDEERGRRYGKLEEYVDSSIKKYDTELHGIRKAVTAPAGAAAFLSDVYSLVSKAPFENFAAASYVLIGTKALAQIPALSRYLKKSHDWYGALRWAGVKSLAFLVPVVGPMIDAGEFERVVRRRVMYEAKDKFLSHVGQDTHEERVKKGLKQTVGDWIDENVSAEPAPALAYA